MTDAKKKIFNFFLTVLLLFAVRASHAHAVKAPHCNQLFKSDVFWTMGEELDRRHQQNTIRLEERMPESESYKRRQIYQGLIETALESAEKAWRNPDNADLRLTAVVDYTVVIDFLNLQNSSSTLKKVDSLQDEISRQKIRIRNKMNSVSNNFQYEFGFSSFEDLLLSWALMTPLAGLSKTTSNTFDAGMGERRESLAELLDHDRRHYNFFLIHINSKGLNEGERMTPIQDFNIKQRLNFLKKHKKASMMILRGLEIMADKNIFPTQKERHLARAIIFEAIHEEIGATPTSSADFYNMHKRRDAYSKNFPATHRVIYGVLKHIKEDFYGKDLLNDEKINFDEVSAILGRIQNEFRKQPEPSWIPHEISN